LSVRLSESIELSNLPRKNIELSLDTSHLLRK
jgi:hypothetical protein